MDIKFLFLHYLYKQIIQILLIINIFFKKSCEFICGEALNFLPISSLLYITLVMAGSTLPWIVRYQLINMIKSETCVLFFLISKLNSKKDASYQYQWNTLGMVRFELLKMPSIGLNLQPVKEIITISYGWTIK